MKVFFRTYGCTLNRADAEMMEALAKEAGHETAASEDEADVVVVNTCTVKLTTENRVMGHLRRLRDSGKRFVISGCMTVDKRLGKMFNAPEVGPSALRMIGRAIDDAANGRQGHYGMIEGKDFLPKVFTPPIARIAIQDGCTDKCHFCQSRLARPKLMSQSIKSIRLSVENALATGCMEIDLSGCDTGAYGIDIGKSIVDLLDGLSGMDGDFRIRLGMANPHHIKRLLRGLLGAYGKGKMFRFMHTSVQTGSEKVAKEMGRGHTVADFGHIVKEMRKSMPDATIETDVIVGYPTETENDFRETMEMLERVRPDIVNLSRFTPRRGTVAAGMKQLPTQVAKERSAKAAALLKRMGLERNRESVGKTVRVLVTEDKKGRAENYRQVAFSGKAKLGEWIEVGITGCTHTTLIGARMRRKRDYFWYMFMESGTIVPSCSMTILAVLDWNFAFAMSWSHPDG
jgi:MiaB-like tRNA modifying enzyme